jgi:surfeit locus 1 family protein
MALKGRDAVVLVAAVLLAALTARLGVWQLDRADQKNRAQQALDERRALPPLSPSALALRANDAAGQHGRLITLAGRWLPERTVYLENRQMDTRVGFYAVTPLLLDDGTAVLVQRGWLPRDQAERTRIVAPAAPAGQVTVWGRIAPGPGRIYDFAGAASGAIRQNLDIGAYARETALPLRPVSVVEEDGPTPAQDGLLRHWAAPAADVQKHYGYAFQWFALSTLTIALYAWFQIIKPAHARRDADRR